MYKLLRAVDNLPYQEKTVHAIVKEESSRKFTFYDTAVPRIFGLLEMIERCDVLCREFVSNFDASDGSYYIERHSFLSMCQN